MQILTPIKAIRAHCIDCCCGNKAEVRRCPTEKCHLHPYRMGHRPRGYKDTPEDEIREETEGYPEVDAGDEED